MIYEYYYEAVVKDYMYRTRDVLQISCGRIVDDARIYTLEPGPCRFTNSEFSVTIPVNEDGYREAGDIETSGASHVAILGDSYAMGWGISDGEDLSAHLASSERYFVKNLAMSSYGTARELLALEKLGFNSDYVVIQYCDNDYAENLAFSKDPVAFRQEYRSHVESFAPELDRVRSIPWKEALRRRVLTVVYRWLVTSWKLAGLPPKSVSMQRIYPEPVREENKIQQEAEAFTHAMKQFRELLADKQIILFESNVYQDLRKEFASVFSATLSNAGIENVHILDTSSMLRPSDYFYIDGHLNASGHRKLGAALLQALDRLPRGAVDDAAPAAR